VVHVVQPGDTLQSLALQYHVPIEQIYYLNGLTGSGVILRMSQQLIISDTNRIYTPPPTVTPLPTSIPLPTLKPTSLPTIIPPIQSVTADHLPQISHDLLFLNNGRLTLWDHLTGQIEILVGPETASTPSIQPVAFMTGPGSPYGSVNGFSVSNDGTKIALSRVVAFTNYEIAFFDLGTRQLTSVYQGGSQGDDLLGMSISPDGQWIAYIPQDLSSSQDHRRPLGLAAPALYPSAGGGIRSGTIYAVRTDQLGEPIPVGVCGSGSAQDYSRDCVGMLWSPDSGSIAWSDGRGIWLAQLGHVAKQLITSTLAMPNNQGQGVYTARSWSPSGRYILMTVSHYEGGTIAVLDAETANLAALPNSFEYSYPGPKVSWINQDQLFVLRPGQGMGGVDPSAETWQVNNVVTLTLVRDRSAIVPVGPESILDEPTQLSNGRLAFAVLNTSNSNYLGRGLYVSDEHDLAAHKINGLPPMKAANDEGQIFNVDISWSPDGVGAIIYDWDSGQVLYVRANGNDLYDLQSVMDENIYGTCCFVWIK
jgi:hypothetical protein